MYQTTKFGSYWIIYVDEARFNQDLSNIDTFGLDETSVAKGYDYITLFVDLYQKAVVGQFDCLKDWQKLRK